MARKISSALLRSRPTRLFADEMNITKCPSPPIAPRRLFPLPCAPQFATLTSAVFVVQPVAPAHVLRTKTSSKWFVSFATKLFAKESKATNCPLLLIVGEELSAFPALALSGVETSVVAAVQLLAPVHASRK